MSGSMRQKCARRWGNPPLPTGRAFPSDVHGRSTRGSNLERFNHEPGTEKRNMKYIVEIKEDGQWVPQGDGPMGKATAERVARELKSMFRISTRIVAA